MVTNHSRPYYHEPDEANDLRSVPMYVVEQLRKLIYNARHRDVQRVETECTYAKESVRNIHAHVYRVTNKREVDQITPASVSKVH